MITQIALATRQQVIALQALWSRWESHSIEAGANTRDARLKWATENTGRHISSFSELSREEARCLIDLLKALMSQPTSERPDPWRRIDSRDRAQAAGTAGRRKAEAGFIQMANADDLARIDELLARLQWTREQFETWLGSPRSPLGKEAGSTIRTVRQANRVYWALKAMLTRTGGWRQSRRNKGPHTAMAVKAQGRVGGA